MGKEFLDELMDELQKLKDEQKAITIPAPVAPHKVIKVIADVAKHHELSEEEKKSLACAAAAMDGDVSASDLEALGDLFRK